MIDIIISIYSMNDLIKHDFILKYYSKPAKQMFTS